MRHAAHRPPRQGETAGSLSAARLAPGSEARDPLQRIDLPQTGRTRPSHTRRNCSRTLDRCHTDALRSPACKQDIRARTRHSEHRKAEGRGPSPRIRKGDTRASHRDSRGSNLQAGIRGRRNTARRGRRRRDTRPGNRRSGLRKSRWCSPGCSWNRHQAEGRKLHLGRRARTDSGCLACRSPRAGTGSLSCRRWGWLGKRHTLRPDRQGPRYNPR